MAFPFRDLPSAATITASGQLLEHLPKNESGEYSPSIINIAIHIEKETEQMNSALAKDRKGELTEEIGTSDHNYNDSFIFFRDSSELLRRNKKNKIVSDSASVVADIIAKYGRTIYRLGRAEQIGKTEAMITEFKLPENQEYLTNAGILDEFTDLCDTHVMLKELMEESANLEAIKHSTISAYEAGRALSKSLSNLYEIVDIYARIGVPEYTTTLELFEESLKKMRPLLRSKGAEADIEV